jgi:hypothetical protein
MIESATQALAFARGEEDNGCEVNIPGEIDVKAIRERFHYLKESLPSSSV